MLKKARARSTMNVTDFKQMSSMSLVVEVCDMVLLPTLKISDKRYIGGGESKKPYLKREPIILENVQETDS